MNCHRAAAFAAFASAAFLAYLRFGRKRVLNWGATPGEVRSTLSGETCCRTSPSKPRGRSP